MTPSGANIHENHLRVLPSFATIATYEAFTLEDIAGFDVDHNLILHGEQSVAIHHPTPTRGSVKNEMRVSSLYDKGKAALIEQTIESHDAAGNHLFTLTSSGFVPGEGGFGGERGPSSGPDTLPERQPDFVVESPTLIGQAFLYRLSGDKNPLHVDPEVSSQLGHEVPILHGLCTYGIACKAAVDALLEGEVSAVAFLHRTFLRRGVSGRNRTNLYLARWPRCRHQRTYKRTWRGCVVTLPDEVKRIAKHEHG